MPVLIPASGFRQQVEEVAKQLSYLSDHVEVGDDEGTPLRATSYFVDVHDPDSGVATTFDYREEFKRTSGGWLRSRYWFELRSSMPSAEDLHSRRAHHQHEPLDLHQHCETPSSPDGHYVDVERLLQATHESFLMQFASGIPIDCLGLVPISTT